MGSLALLVPTRVSPAANDGWEVVDDQEQVERADDPVEHLLEDEGAEEDVGDDGEGVEKRLLATTEPVSEPPALCRRRPGRRPQCAAPCRRQPAQRVRFFAFLAVAFLV